MSDSAPVKSLVHITVEAEADLRFPEPVNEFASANIVSGVQESLSKG